MFGVAVVCEPSASSAVFDDAWGSQDQYVDTAGLAPPAGGNPNVFQRLSNADLSSWRVLGDTQYEQQITVNVSPVNWYWDESSSVHHFQAWYFTALAKQLSEVPASVTKLVDIQPPYPLFFCSKGSWDSTSGCALGYSAGFDQGGLLDQSFQQFASDFVGVAKYFRTGILASGSGTTSYTSDALTDTAENFAGDVGDCVSATVIDSNGFPDWVTGTVAGVGGAGNDTVTLSANWSTSESYDSSVGRSGLITSSTPASGAAYNLAPCTPPSGLTTPQDVTPWPMFPSVGNVQDFEIVDNEPDLSQTNLNVTNPALTAPTPTLTGVNVSGGTLTPGTTYTYEMAAAGSSSNLSTPGTQASITLPSGDNAVQVAWSATSSNDLNPYAYIIYGRTSGSQLGLAAIGEDSSSIDAQSFSWTDTGTITPFGAPSGTNNSGGKTIFTPYYYTAAWNVIAPEMKAVDPTIKLVGPAISSTNGGGSPPWTDVFCATTKGVSSACTNGDPGWSHYEGYVPELSPKGNLKSDIISMHAYGGGSSTEQNNFETNTSLNNQTVNYKNDDQAAIDSANVPVWLDEMNIDPGNSGNPVTGTNQRSMTQMGAAWIADSIIAYDFDPYVQALDQFASQGQDASWDLWGLGNLSGTRPACRDQPVRTRRPTNPTSSTGPCTGSTTGSPPATSSPYRTSHPASSRWPTKPDRTPPS